MKLNKESILIKALFSMIDGVNFKLSPIGEKILMDNSIENCDEVWWISAINEDESLDIRNKNHTIIKGVHLNTLIF